MNKIIWMGLIITLLTLIFFVVLIPIRVTEHQIIKTPYDVIEPYSEREAYTVQEPYDYSYRECVEHSFWTGDCTEYDTRHVTRYKTVTQYRTITKYNVEYKNIKHTKFATFFQMLNGDVIWWYDVEK